MIHVTLRLLTLGLPLALLYRRKSILPCAERPTIYLRKFDFGSTSRDLLVIHYFGWSIASSRIKCIRKCQGEIPPAFLLQLSVTIFVSAPHCAKV